MMTAMGTVAEMQLRIVYSMLKPAVRAAAHFGVPIRSLIDLMRLAYFEHLKGSGLRLAEIAQVFGQTERHMRSLSRRLEGDFFAAERDVGLEREVEAFIASRSPTAQQVESAITSWEPSDVRRAVAHLIEEGRVQRSEPDGTHLETSQRYVLLRSDGFHHRIDAINHFLDGAYRAVLHRLIFDDKRTAVMKTISFSALADKLRGFLDGLEGDLRRELADLDESATFQGRADERYILALALAPIEEQPRDHRGREP